MPLLRALSLTVAIVLFFATIFLREATSPSGSGYWPAVAAAPGGGLYVADEGRAELRLIRDGEPDRVMARLPHALYRGLVAGGTTFILATQGGLYVSADGGTGWTLKVPGRFTAVALRGREALAGAWNDGLWRSRDGGLSWDQVPVPAADTEFESLAITDRAELAATLLGILVSTDGGSTWSAASGVGNRVTALDGLSAGDWQGNLYQSLDGRRWTHTDRVPGGVWSLAGPLAGTTSGLYLDGRATNGLGGREITRVVSSPPNYYALVARGPVYFSKSGADWRLSRQG